MSSPPALARTPWVERLFGRPWPGLLLLMVGGLLPGLGALSAPLLLGFDDKYATVQNPLIVNGFGYFFQQLLRPLQADPGLGYATAHWAPLSFLSEAVDHALFGRGGVDPEAFAPWGFRLMTGFYHGLCGWLVLRLGRRLTGRLGVALFAALVFLFHPTVCETVCWVVERNNVLPALLGLWALVLYSNVKEGSEASWPRTFSALGLLFLAQLGKASAVSWWPVLVAWDVLFFKGSTWFRRAGRAALLFLPVAMSLYVLSISHHDVMMPPLGEGVLGPWLMALYLTVRYLGLLIWPVNLSFFYHVSPAGPDWLVLLGGWAGAAVAVAWARWAGVPWRRLILYALWIAVGFAPYINPIRTTSFPLQDRYLYLSLPGFGLFLAETLGGTHARLGWKRIRLQAAGLLAVLLALALARSLIFRHETLLFTDAIHKQPESAFGYSYLANYLFHASADVRPAEKQREMWREVRAIQRKAYRCDDFERMISPLWVMIEDANVRYALGDGKTARMLFRKVWEGRPERISEKGAKFEALRFLAFDAFKNRKAYADGFRWSELALRLDPRNPELLRNRLEAWKDTGQYDRARSEARRLLRDTKLRVFAEKVLKALPPGTAPKRRPSRERP